MIRMSPRNRRRNPTQARSRRSRFTIEHLEPRQVLSAAPIGAEFLANTVVSSAQRNAAIAADSDGDFVIVWQSTGQDGSGDGVYAQRYSAAGAKLGSEFRVNVTITGSQTAPAVAMDSDGDFVVAWQSAGQDGSGEGIYARQFTAGGVALGGEFRVNTSTTNDQTSPAVAVDANGNFAIAWQSNGTDSSGYGIFARQFGANGIAAGSEFQVNTYTLLQQTAPSIAMDLNGDFAIVWQSSNQEGAGNGSGIYLQRFDPSGSPAGAEIHVNSTVAGEQAEPAVAVDAGGNMIVTWVSGSQLQADIYAQRFSAAGSPLGVETKVVSALDRWDASPAIAANSAGDYVIVWQSTLVGSAGGEGQDVYARQFHTDGVPAGLEVRVNSYFSSDQHLPAITMDAAGNIVAAWQSNGQDSSGLGVFAQRFRQYNLPSVLGLFTTNNAQEITANEQIVDHPQQLVVAFSESLSNVGGATGSHSITNPANWRITENGVDASAKISNVAFSYNLVSQRYEASVNLTAPLSSGSIVIELDDRVENLLGLPLDGNADLTPGGDFQRAFSIAHIAPSGDEQKVDLTTIGQQNYAAVATAANGDYVVVWEGVNENQVPEIRGRRFNAAGQPQGAAFKVNQGTAGPLQRPQVAMAADGSFIVTWMASDGGGSGIFARRFTSSGFGFGNEFRVNTYTTNTQWGPQIDADVAGNFVITWESPGQDGSGDGVYAQRFDSTGTKVGGEFRVNVSTSGDQGQPDVALDADGDFVIVWSDLNSSHFGQYFRRYDKSGNALTGELVVKSLVSGGTVAMDSAGNFAVAWIEPSVEGSDRAVHARLFDANGVPRGADFLVQSHPTSQFEVDISMDADGDFAVVWQQHFINDNPRFDIYARRFNAAGAPQGTQFRVNVHDLREQEKPAIAMDPDGEFVIAWESRTAPFTEYAYEIYAQRYAADVSGTRIIQAHLDVPTQSIVLKLNEELSTAGGETGAASVTNPLNWRLTLDGVDISDRIDAISTVADYLLHKYEVRVTIDGAIADGEYALTLQDDVTNLAAIPLDGQGNGIPGGDFVKTFIVSTTTPVASESVVNVTTAGDQNRPAIVMDESGDYVVIWQSFKVGLDYDLFGRRFHADGTPAGGEFPVSTYPTNSQSAAAVAMDASGNYVVVWESVDQDGDSRGVYGRRFDPFGTPLSDEFRVNTTTAGPQDSPTIVMDRLGNFVVAWSSGNHADGYGAGIFAQRFTATGVRIGNEFLVNTTTEREQTLPSAAIDAAGNFIIVWQSGLQDGSDEGIYAQRFHPDGVKRGGEFRVNTKLEGPQTWPKVAANANGQFVVVWTDEGIYARTFSPDGIALEPAFQVSDQNEGGSPSVKVDASGDFVIAWASDALVEGNYEVFVKQLSAGGSVHGTQQVANTFSPNEQSASAIAISPEGDFVVAWHSNGQDGDRAGIYARHYLVSSPVVVPGDFDFDNDVDGADFVAWQTHFPTAAGATRSMGDADSDGDVDGADFVVWQTNFPTAANTGAVEPTTASASASSAPITEPSNAAAAPPANAGGFAASTTNLSNGISTHKSLGANADGSNAGTHHPIIRTISNSAQVPERSHGILRLPQPSDSQKAPTLATTRETQAEDSIVPSKHAALSPSRVDYWLQTSTMYRSRSFGRLAGSAVAEMFDDIL
jgi:hypothetical protein